MGYSPGRTGAIEFQRAMVFIDGTNTFYRLAGARRRLKNKGALHELCECYVRPRQIVRMHLYTTKPHLAKAKEIHGEDFAHGLKVTLGHAVPDGSGNYKEKGVDAMLVADMVYHARPRTTIMHCWSASMPISHMHCGAWKISDAARE